jgi:hypothetical protein
MGLSEFQGSKKTELCFQNCKDLQKTLFLFYLNQEQGSYDFIIDYRFNKLSRTMI